MFQEFNTDTVESRFIKNIIYNTPLPLFKTVQEGDWLTAGCSYIYKRNMLKCTKSGFIAEGSPKCNYEITGDYIFGNFYPTFTQKYMPHNVYYDHYTHEMLGTYLRCFRDLKGVDLMPFYNCYSGYYTNVFHIRNNHFRDGSSLAYKVALFPIKFNVEYTIAVDCSSMVTILPVLLNDEVPVTAVYNSQLIDLSLELSTQIRNYSNSSFRQPFKFSVKTYTEEFEDVPYAKYLQQNETHLYAALQLPANNDSSIVVLEGDYTNLHTDKVFERDALYDLTDKEINRLLLSPLTLLGLNDRNQYAFSDRLVEYLTLNVVDRDEEIENNITLFQGLLGLESYNEVAPGVWDDIMRYDSFELYKDNYTSDERLRFLDINGFIDKDIERFLIRGVDYD